MIAGLKTTTIIADQSLSIRREYNFTKNEFTAKAAINYGKAIEVGSYEVATSTKPGALFSLEPVQDKSGLPSLKYDHFSHGKAGVLVGEGGRIVSITTFNIDPGCGSGLLGGKVALRLTKGIETWAWAQEAMHVLYHVTGGFEIARADRFVRRIGIKQLGRNYGARLIWEYNKSPVWARRRHSLRCGDRHFLERMPNTNHI